jgi:fatty acid desaturase
MRHLARAAVVRHAVAIAAPIAALCVVPSSAPIAALAATMAAFLLTHDLAHGALGLSRRTNDLAIAIGGLLMATSGHGLRLMHLRHHADPEGDDDLEGISARLPPLHALAIAPWLYVRLVVCAWRTATPRDRAWQCIEHIAVAATAVAAVLGARPLQIYVATALALQLLTPFWAGHVPHRPPAWMLAIARPLARLGSLTMTTFAVHRAHHRQPKVPIYQLRAAALPPYR